MLPTNFISNQAAITWILWPRCIFCVCCLKNVRNVVQFNISDMLSALALHRITTTEPEKMEIAACWNWTTKIINFPGTFERFRQSNSRGLLFIFHLVGRQPVPRRFIIIRVWLDSAYSCSVTSTWLRTFVHVAKIYRKKINRVNSYKLKFNQIGKRSDRCLQDRRIRCTDAYGSGREPQCLKILFALRYLIWNIIFVSEMFDTSKCNGINSLCTN